MEVSKDVILDYYELSTGYTLFTLTCGRAVVLTNLLVDALEVSNKLYEIKYKVKDLNTGNYKIYLQGLDKWKTATTLNTSTFLTSINSQNP